MWRHQISPGLCESRSTANYILHCVAQKTHMLLTKLRDGKVWLRVTQCCAPKNTDKRKK